MRILFLSVGKPKQQESISLFEDYCNRMRRMAVPVEGRWVRETSGEDRLPAEQATGKEASALLAAIPKRCRVIALDRDGKMFDSPGLASRIEEWTTPSGVFVIGGPLGLHSSVLDRADHRWSLSPLTFPHDLARALIAEQVYRALTLVRSIPYHK